MWPTRFDVRQLRPNERLLVFLDGTRLSQRSWFEEGHHEWASWADCLAMVLHHPDVATATSLREVRQVAHDVVEFGNHFLGEP